MKYQIMYLINKTKYKLQDSKLVTSISFIRLGSDEILSFLFEKLNIIKLQLYGSKTLNEQ